MVGIRYNALPLALPLLAFALLSSPAWGAQQAGESGKTSQGEVLRTEPVVVEAEPYLISPALAGEPVVELELPQLAGLFPTLADLVGSLGGITVTRYGNPVALSTLRGRGAPSSHTRVMLNGVPLSTGALGTFDFSSLPTRFMRKVELVLGGSLLSGPASDGVAVNLITGGHGEPAITLWGGSFSSGGVDLSLPVGERLVDLSLSGTRGNFPFQTVNGSFRRRMNNEARRAEISFEQTGEEASLTLLALADRQGVPGPGEFPSREAELGRAVVMANLALPDRQAGIRRDLLGGVNLLISKQHFSDPRPITLDPIDSRRTGLELTGAARLVERQGRDAFTLAAELSLAHLNASEVDAPSRLGLGMGLSWQRRFSDLDLTFSLRGDWASDQGALGGAGLILSHPMGDGARVSLRLRASGRFPDFNELYLTNLGFIRGNPELSPERSRSAELSYLGRVMGGEFRASIYRSRYRSQILFLPVDFFHITPQNTTGSRVVGAELSWQRALSDNGPFLSLSANYLEAEFSDGSDLPGLPRWQVGMALGKKWGRLEGRAAFTWTAPRPFRPQATLAARRVADLSLSLGWRVDRRSKVILSGYDLLGRGRYDQFDFPLPRRSWEVRLTLRW